MVRLRRRQIISSLFLRPENDSFDTVNVPIPFEVRKLNTGGAMNLTSGIFTTPRPGTYFFTFTGNFGYYGPSTAWFAVIALQRDGKRVGLKRIEDTIGDVFRELTIQSTLNLKAGEQIWLEIFAKSDGVSLIDYKIFGFSHFTGFLLEENLADRL